MEKKVYTIDKVAEFSGVSVRTLRHYDEINLLKPVARNSTGHRLYGEAELLRLQQILFYKELDFSLEQTKKILEEKSFDLLSALEDHKVKLAEKLGQLNKLIQTIDKTILNIKAKDQMLEHELYDGFTREEIAEMEVEVDNKFDQKLVRQSRDRVRNFTDKQISHMKTTGTSYLNELMKLMDIARVEDERVQEQVKEHYEMVNVFYTPTKEIFKGLADAYVQDERFKRFYDKLKPGLADFLSRAMHYYAEHSM